MSDNTVITSETVEHIAGLAHIALTPEETENYAAELTQILSAIAKISEVASADVPPTSHPVALVNVTRPDEVRDVLTQQEALQNAPASAAGKFQVTAILGEEQ
ncbi:Asp-tRNA(Asn)/Glu-tRNA(Gln) amidotransferase subunit GatC [Canibacter sp. lx-72]|uniref:Asp-tRNA(Asn)/Glu-tRNA(Gln) amidotransferase subunit GatC n=1 Tax=Canibacter zhuwentaonis TaxID=2837491 RepID=UPI001BDC406A|nr:Asp-tRNA(Asn)/Glu-tRNA(Gln) amidotransferase subunit GatC [Canibacter zhuwentaonis]MBT1017774.1 Asp-tRNA(Asn)/Glu-tRNA(Gln) amidotransferase subunit GatC [Canibacter zhuwentaonis]MBT1034929.1 Asp-tRNA(Asn)/Glu-tRNA(Gln) amidotransferase subunit GatC [Canibacter zhuwentaonis]